MHKLFVHKKLISSCLFISLIGLAILSLNIGGHSANLLDFLNQKDSNILFISRIPRLIALIIGGLGISMAGLLIQSLQSNRYLSPSTMGLNSWCRLGMVLAIVFFNSHARLSKMLLAFAITLFGSYIFLYFINKLRVKNEIIVPLYGILLGEIISAITTFIAYYFNIIQNINSWMQASFSLVIQGEYELIYLSFIALILIYLFAREFSVAGLGKNIATNLGLNYQLFQFIGLSIIALLVSSVLITVGSIPFLGLIIPNIVRSIYGDHLKNNILICGLLGANILLLCDILSRILYHPYEIPISIILNILGSIIFIFILLKANKS